MHRGSDWFVAQAISAIRHGIGSRIAFDAVRRGKRTVPPARNAGEVPLRGFAMTLRVGPCLVIEDAVGCRVRVLSGQAWITAEGAPLDTIADAGATVPLEAGVRFNVSAFHDAASVVIAAPRHLRNVRFGLRKRDGMHVLIVTAGANRLASYLAGSAAAIAAFARRGIAPTATAPL